MPVPSFLSRFRSRTTSQSTVPSLSSSAADHIPPTGTIRPISQPPPLFARKILEDPDSYLDLNEEPITQDLTASRRHSVDDSGTGLHIRRQRPPLDRTLETDKRGVHSEIPCPTAHALPTKINFSERISRLPSAGRWSTFGRNKDRQNPKISEFTEQGSPRHSRIRNSYSPSLRRSFSNKRNKDPSNTGSIHSIATPNRSVNQSRPSTAPHESQLLSGEPSRDSFGEVLANAYDSRGSSPTRRSPSKRAPNRPRSNTAPTVHSSRSVITQQPATPRNQQPAVDSPRTFGHPTPPEARSAFTFPHQSPPPPLPPLNHPELASSQPKLLVHQVFEAPNSTTLRSVDDHLKGLPSRIRGSSSDSFHFLTETLNKRSVRHRASLPGTHQVFSSDAERSNIGLNRKPSRARTISSPSKVKRRTSADWSAHQATIGVLSTSDHSWPADVSREILRLSLGQGLGETASASAGPALPGIGTRPASTDENNDVPRESESNMPTDLSNTFSSIYSYHRLHRPPVSREAPSLIGFNLTGPISDPYHTHFRNTGWDKMDDRLHETNRSTAKGSASDEKLDNAQATKNMASRHDTLEVPTIKTPGHSSRTLRHTSSVTTPILETPPRHPPVAQTSYLQLPSAVVTPSRTMSVNSKGKRKAEDVDVTPPDQKKESQRATFVIPSEGRTQRISASGSSSHAPSSYHRKRARLSPPTPSQSRPASAQVQTNPLGSWSIQTGARALKTSSAPSRDASTRSNNPPPPRSLSRQRSDSRRSMSQISIPISALISPHAPSITASSKFHMRDPRKPWKKLHDTEWALRFKTEEEPGSPLHAWAFFIGFIIFPLWWIAALFINVPETRTVGEPDIEKSVTIDDPQVEHDAKTWRFRCRIMSIISLFTYIPFIVLVAIFVR